MVLSVLTHKLIATSTLSTLLDISFVFITLPTANSWKEAF
jgi:hypothetical protein